MEGFRRVRVNGVNEDLPHGVLTMVSVTVSELFVTKKHGSHVVAHVCHTLAIAGREEWMRPSFCFTHTHRKIKKYKNKMVLGLGQFCHKT